MRLLQITKRPEIVGGTVGCIWSICQALPDWSHAVFSRWQGEIPQRTRAALAGHTLYASPTISAEALRRIAPSVILLHNVSDEDLPAELLPEGVPVFYYCHGSYDGLLESSKGLREASCKVFCVSKFLAREVGLEGTAWYQPVPSPPRIHPAAEDWPFVVGRLCNPRSENWFPGLVGFYRELAERCPGIRWEFVGCPDELRQDLEEACVEAVFLPAGLEARAHLRRWHAMLYHTPITHAYGRTVCEAQQAGCVPVADRRGGFIEQIDHSQTGFLCESLDDFVVALGELRDPARRRACARAASEAGKLRGSLELWRERFLEHCRRAREAA